MLYKNKPPLFIGHRGSPWKFPENTPQSCLHAIESGADGIEMDIQKTYDNQIIVFHDDYITDLKNNQHSIVNLSYSKLNEISIKKYNQKVYLLDEILKVIPARTLVNIEIKSKNTNNYTLIKKLGPILNRNYNQDHIVISSFNYIVLYQYKIFNRDTRIGLLLENINFLQICRVKFYRYFIKPNFIYCNYKTLTPKFLEWAKSKDMQIIVYTVNDLENLKQCLEMGVYGIITDNYNFYH